MDGGARRTRRGGGVAWCATVVAVLAGCESGPEGPVVVDGEGRPVAGALVTARDSASGRAFTVYTDADGRYALPALPAAVDSVEVRGPAAEATPRGRAARGGPVTLSPADSADEPPGSAFLAQLPDDARTRRWIVDCGGCHVFGSTHARSAGAERTEAEWGADIERMVAMAGQGSGFPVISSEAHPEGDAAWLADALAGAPWPRTEPYEPAWTAGAAGAVLTEYDVPAPQDLPHDLAVDDAGQVLVTGMFTHRMYVLDPESGVWETVPIPVESANPRAVDIDDEGRWWVLLGAPAAVAGYQPADSSWRTYSIGMYPHSLHFDSAGGVWYNGHFTADPELIGRLDPETGQTRRFEVPATDPRWTDESTIPYGLRVDPRRDVVWATQLRGNHLIRLDPATGETRLYPMPTAEAGPRRLDVGPDGVVWIPEFGAGRLARFDPETEEFREFDLPVPATGPYAARVDPRRGTVWIGTGHGDHVLAFDPATERFTVYPLPTRGALVRHLDVDERTGDLWAAYGASPGIPSKVLRLRPGGPPG